MINAKLIRTEGLDRFKQLSTFDKGKKNMKKHHGLGVWNVNFPMVCDLPTPGSWNPPAASAPWLVALNRNLAFVGTYVSLRPREL